MRAKTIQRKGLFPFRVVFLIALSLPVFGCPLYNPESFVQPPAAKSILVVATQVTLVWDPPATGAPVTSYVLRYRVHGTSAWTTLATIPATTQPSYTVQHSTVGNGFFDFEVAAATDSGATSAFHTSLDSNAVPTTGWYLTWEGP